MIQKKTYVRSIEKYYQIDRSQIAYLKFILEAYDGLAVMSTVDASHGVVVVYIPPGCEKEMEMLMRAMEKEILIEPVDEAAARTFGIQKITS